MSEIMHKSHNVSRLMYHFVFPTKYRRVVIDDEVEEVIKETCMEISKMLSGKLNDAPSGRLFRADFRTLQMCQSL